MFASGCQSAGYIFTDKTCSAKYAYGVVLHVRGI
jgi:hypothetical protein